MIPVVDQLFGKFAFPGKPAKSETMWAAGSHEADETAGIGLKHADPSLQGNLFHFKHVVVGSRQPA